MAVAGVPAHQHCEICGDVVATDVRFCGKECEERHEEIQADKKRSMWRFVALIAALALLFTAIDQGWL